MVKSTEGFSQKKGKLMPGFGGLKHGFQRHGTQTRNSLRPNITIGLWNTTRTCKGGTRDGDLNKGREPCKKVIRGVSLWSVKRGERKGGWQDKSGGDEQLAKPEADSGEFWFKQRQ